MEKEPRNYAGEFAAVGIGVIAALLLRVWMPADEPVNFTAVLIAGGFVFYVITVCYLFMKRK
jgi:hypothetical protein